MTIGQPKNLKNTTVKYFSGNFNGGLTTTAWALALRCLFTLIFLVVCLLLFAPVTFLQAEIVPSINYIYYPVKITTAKNAYHELVAASPLCQGKPCVGYNQARIRYKYKYEKNFDICEIYEPEVAISCEVMLPDYQSRDALLKNTMDTYSYDVKKHELTHCSISTSYANKWKKKLGDYGRVKCADLKKIVKQGYREIIEASTKANKKFDQDRKDKKHFRYDLHRHLKMSLPFPHQATRSRTALSNLNPAEKTSDSGIYQDKNGVWRNH